MSGQAMNYRIGDEVIAALNTGRGSRRVIEGVDSDRTDTPKRPYLLLKLVTREEDGVLNLWIGVCRCTKSRF